MDIYRAMARPINGAEITVSVVRAGLGSAVPVFQRLVRIDAGDLVRLLLDGVEAHAVFRIGQSANPAARAFVGHLVEELRPV